MSVAARLIYRHRKFDHVSPLLKELHWLRVPERITFRLAVLAYRCQHNMAPHYLTAQLHQASSVGYWQLEPCSMFLAPNTWPSVAVRSVQLQLMFEHFYNWHCTCQMTLLLRNFWQINWWWWWWLTFPQLFAVAPQPCSLSTIMLLWHSFWILIIINSESSASWKHSPPNHNNSKAAKTAFEHIAHAILALYCQRLVCYNAYDVYYSPAHIPLTIT